MPSSFEVLPASTPEELAGPVELPVQLSERLPTLDILRGFALLGILLLNIEVFAGKELLSDFPIGLAKPALVGWHRYLDYAIVIAKWVFAEGRMRILFSMLFGAGTILLIERIEQRSGAARSRSIFFRRNLWLLLFGLFHGIVLWHGDILVDYAATALVFLYPLRRLSTRTLITAGLLVSVAGGTFSVFRGHHVLKTIHHETQLSAARQAGSSATPQQQSLLAAEAQQQRKAVTAQTDDLKQGRLGFLEGWPHRRSEWVAFSEYKFGGLRFLEWLGAMMTGMGLYKSGYLTNRRPQRDYVLVALAGYAVAVPIVLVGLWQVQRAGFNAAADAKWMWIPYCLEINAGALANTSVLLLLLRRNWLASVTRPLAAVGRTAFSNYLLTTVLCQFLFAWGPWKLYGKLEFYQWYLVVAAVWTLNLTLSSAWLRFFAFGPLEWLWRSLTYWKLQPTRVNVLQTKRTQ